MSDGEKPKDWIDEVLEDKTWFGRLRKIGIASMIVTGVIKFGLAIIDLTT